MPHITLRTTAHQSNPSDIQLSVKENTLEYLLQANADEVRVSAYVDQALEKVERSYAELFVSNECMAKYKVSKIIPGSKTRKVVLPDAMQIGEQLTILVQREK